MAADAAERVFLADNSTSELANLWVYHGGEVQNYMSKDDLPPIVGLNDTIIDVDIGPGGELLGSTRPHLFHVDEDATATSGWHEVPTTPSLRVAAEQQDQYSLFYDCAIAAAPSGAVYIQSTNQLWRVDPAE